MYDVFYMLIEQMWVDCTGALNMHKTRASFKAYTAYLSLCVKPASEEEAPDWKPLREPKHFISTAKTYTSV